MSIPKKLDWPAFLGNAPRQDFDDYRFRNWRWFWDFGNGILTDLMVHWIDVAHWLFNLDHPERAVTIGANVTSRGVWQTPDTIQTLLVYPGDVQIYFEGTFCNARNGAMMELMGTDATLYIDRGRFELIPEARNKQKPEEMILGKGPRGRDFMTSPTASSCICRTGSIAFAAGASLAPPIAAGVSAATAAHLGNQAFRGSGVAVWGK